MNEGNILRRNKKLRFISELRRYILSDMLRPLHINKVNKTIKQFYKEEFKAYPWLGNAWIVIYADSEGKYIRYAGKLKDMNNSSIDWFAI